jgi:cytochrome c-type biogenesis protein CcmE
VVVGNHFENRNADMKKRTWLVSVGLTLAMVGLLGTGTAVAATPPGGGARSGAADGGATGIVETVSTSSITLTTATGVEVTADEDSATKYKLGSLPATVHAVRTGESVLVLGLVDNSTIAATEIVVQPGGDGGVREAARAGVIPFQQGVSSPTKSVGQIPSDYTEGDGTIVSGTVADKATAAAQAVVPGGIVDRVVRLSDGEYEVHNISVNWPHHVFVSSDFTVLGYE